MIFFVLILLLIIFSAASVTKANEFNTDYISRDATNNIKGIFVILILFSHAKGYIQLDGVYDSMYSAVQNHLNQMVVAMFLFYSGYGIMEQIKKREFAYIQSIPTKRFPNLLLNFDIAVCFYIILYLALGKRLTFSQILQGLTAWNGIGNSSWYIFVTFVLYIITCLSFFFIKWSDKKIFKLLGTVILTALSIIFISILMHDTPKERFWYNTAILYALGFWYSLFKDSIEKWLMRNDILYFTVLALLTAVYIFTYLHRWDRFFIYEIWAVLFTLGVVLITMKVKIESNLLKWFGEHIFSIYILQRIPMIIFTELGIAARHKYIFIIISIAATIPFAAMFDHLTGKLSKVIWKPKKTLTK